MATESRTILVVDDDDMMRVVAARLLRRGGFVVVDAATAVAALAVLSSQAIDLVLTDVHMPDTNGFALVSRMRETHPNLPVVFMSGHHEHGDEGCARAGGSFVAKPFTPSSLRGAVQAALDLADAQRA